MAYLQTDEELEVAQAMAMAANFAQGRESDPHLWRWIILALHSAAQGAMVLSHPQVNPAAITPASQPEYLDDNAAARLFNISVASLKKWRRLPQGPPYRKIGSAVRYSRTELPAWLSHQPGLEVDPKGKPSNR